MASPSRAGPSGVVGFSRYDWDILAFKPQQRLTGAMGMMVLVGALLAPSRLRAAPADEGQILGTFPVGTVSYELAIDRCPVKAPADPSYPPGCPFVIRLLEADKTLDRVRLYQPPCGSATRTTVDRVLGADPEARAWSTTDEHCQIDIAARTVELAPGIIGLLVTQRAGYEYAYRSHVLYLAESGKLKSLWNHDEGELGQNWTTTTVIPGVKPHQKDIAFVDVRSASEGTSAYVTARRLRFKAAKHRMVESPLPDASTQLFLVKVAVEKGEGDERAQRCLRLLDTFEARRFPRMVPAGRFRGAVFVRRADAFAARDELAKCPGIPAPVVLRYTAGGMKAEAKTP
jgi:hypothetical protein